MQMLNPLIVAGVFALLFLLEHFFPLRKTTRFLLARLALNLAISAFTFIAAAGLVQPVARWALRWSAQEPFGLTSISQRCLGGWSLRSVFC